VAATIAVPSTSSGPSQLEILEKELLGSVEELKKRNRIIGNPFTLEEMLNLVEERQIGDSPIQFDGGDKEIVS